jgi:hypothetical protein
MFGLAAITAEAEEKHWATKLTTDEASLAARYAPIQLNGCPTWLEDLAAVHPAAVESVLGKELTSELDEEIETERPSMTLQNIIYSPQAVRALFIPRLLAYLERLCNSYRENSKVSARCLSQILDLLLKHESAPIDEELKTLAVAELQFGLRAEIAQVWLGVLFQLDPSEGLDQLEKLLNESSSSEDVKLNVFASIFGERNVDSITGWASTKFTPTQLLRLLRLAYRHVHPSLDVPHEGAFTPNLRDNAEYGRNVILTTLLNARGHEGWLAKLEMAKDPLFAHFRDRAIAIAEERAAEEADGVARDEASVTSLDRYKEAAPSTREEMFALMSDRLDDIEDLLLQDISPRAAWSLIKDETVMRREIARELFNRRNHAYGVDQEAVTADQKETDIRLRSTGSKQQAIIELKIGEKNRTARALRTALRDQLVKKYMAGEDCRSGCLLITSGKRVWRNPDTNAVMDLTELIAMLNLDAARIVEEMGGSLRLMARGLDLRPRLCTEAQKRPGKVRNKNLPTS